MDSATQVADDELAKKAGYVSVTDGRKARARPAADEDGAEADHVEGAPSWVRVPKGKAKATGADAASKNPSGKAKNEVWEV